MIISLERLNGIGEVLAPICGPGQMTIRDFLARPSLVRMREFIQPHRLTFVILLDDSDDNQYYLLRYRQEVLAAEQAASQSARESHLRLARFYLLRRRAMGWPSPPD